MAATTATTPPSRLATPTIRRANPRFAVPNAIPVALRWLLEDSRHANMVVRDYASIIGARREIKRILNLHSQECVYLDSMQAQQDLERTVRVDEEGRVRIEDGPFRNLLHTGGTLLVNVPHFSPQQLETFNTLMEEQVWEGTEVRQRVRVVFLCDADALQKNLLSGAQISRTAFRDLSAHSFPDCEDPPVAPAKSEHPPGTRIIDLEGDLLWRRVLFGGPAINSENRWQQRSGMLNEDFRYPVVLRNPPQDPYLNDLIAEWISAGKDVHFEQGVPQEEFAQRVANKRAASVVDRLQLRKPGAPVCTINAINLDETLNDYIGVRGNAPALLPSHLSTVASRLGDGRLPLVLVGSVLTPSQWDKLMLHSAGFCAAVAPGIEVPSKYERHVTRLIAGAIYPDRPEPSVNFLLSADDSLADLPRNGNATHIFVTPDMRVSSLVSSLKRVNGGAADTGGVPSVAVEYKQMFNDLANNRTVVLHGLENNPDLAGDLATLLHPPHYLRVNGAHYYFGLGGRLTGSLIVVSGDRELCSRYALSPRREHVIGSDAQWKRAIQEKLLSRIQVQHRDVVNENLPKLFRLFDALQAQGLIARKTPCVSYREVETLVQHLFARSAPAEDPEQLQKRLLRSFFKDMFIGDYRRTEQREDDRYEQLKFLLRTIFPVQMEAMPSAHVDIRRLEKLLRRVEHPNEISTNAWRFLNCFSQDVTGAIASSGRGSTSALGDGTVALVLEQARHHGLHLPPLLAQEAHRRGLPSGGSNRLDAYLRPPRQNLDSKNLAKAELAQSQGKAMFFKGPPGAGKTHMATVLTNNSRSTRHMANIADIGTQPYADRLEAWARDESDNRPTLIVDEANLARDGSHDMLRAMAEESSLLVNGRRTQLSSEHKVIFTGNVDAFPGRSPQGVAETFAKIQFKAMDEPALRARFVTPLLEHALSLPRLRRAAGLRDYVEQHAANIHVSLQKAYPEKNLSPRNLEEYVAQIVCRLRSRKQKRNVEALAPWMARLALNVYGGVLPDEDGPVLEAWLRQQFGVAPQTRLPGMPSVSSSALKAAGMAPTKATRELADSVAWWLKSQQLRAEFSHKEKTLGQKALLIEGPASRGKDDVVKAVLDAKGVAYLHINANPNSLQHLRDTIAQAREDGNIVIISELNLLPSDILEGELNALLTGDVAAAPGFSIIATVNPPGYAGRKPLSPALENRMLKKVIGDYPAKDVHAIALSLASKAKRRMARGYISLPYGWLARKTVNGLVRRHQMLSDSLADYPSEHKPKIRELRDTIQALSSRPKLRLDDAFENHYAYYLRLAGESEGARLNVTHSQEADAEVRMKEQLKRLLSLARPEWLSPPELIVDPGQLLAAPIEYDAQTHRLRFSPLASPSRLYAGLLTLLGEGLMPAIPDVPAVSETSKVAGDPLAVDSIPHGAVNRTQQKSSDSAPSAAAEQPVSMAPVVGISAVGREEITGTIGSISNDSPDGTRLVQTRLLLNGRIIPTRATEFANAVPGIALAGNKAIQLNNLAGMPHQGAGYRIYLPVPIDTRPALVELDDASAGAVFRDGQGGWYVLSSSQVVARARYRLAVQEEPVQSPRRDRLFTGLTMRRGVGDGETTIDAILTLADTSKGRSRQETVESLRALFADPRYFKYSRQDAKALGRLPDSTGRMQYFLEHGKGVCYEFANSFSAVLEQVFDIPTHVCHGHSSEDGQIDREGHAWVEYYGSDGRWHTVDPTPSTIIQNAPAIAAVPDNEGGFGSSYLDIYGDNVFQIPPDVQAHFSPAKLGLQYWDLRNDGTRYKAVGNTLVLERLIRGEVEMYLDQSASTSAHLRTVVLEDLPPFGNVDGWRRFLVLMTRPFQALIDGGVPVSFYNKGREIERMTVSSALQAHGGMGPNATKVRLDDETRLAIGQGSGHFLMNLASHYYESVLAARGVDLNNSEAAIDCLIDDLAPLLETTADEVLPLEIHLQNAVFKLALTDWQRHLINREMAATDIPMQQVTRLLELVRLGDISTATVTDPVYQALDKLQTPKFIGGLGVDERLALLKTYLENLRFNTSDDIKTWFLRHALEYARNLRMDRKLIANKQVLADVFANAFSCSLEGFVNIDDLVQEKLLVDILKELPTMPVESPREQDIIRRHFDAWRERNPDKESELVKEIRRIAYSDADGDEPDA